MLDEGQIPKCRCFDWNDTLLPCKHMFAVFENCTDYSWESLPKMYRDSLYLMLDPSCCLPTVNDQTHVNDHEVTIPQDLEGRCTFYTIFSWPNTNSSSLEVASERKPCTSISIIFYSTSIFIAMPDSLLTLKCDIFSYKIQHLFLSVRNSENTSNMGNLQ